MHFPSVNYFPFSLIGFRTNLCKRNQWSGNIIIGREIRKRCGNEGWHPYLDEVGRTTLRFLRAANTFIRDAEEDGADMENAAFILRQPGREFVIISGDGDLEYDFCDDDDGEICGRCERKPFLYYVWDNVKSKAVRVFSFLVGLLPIVED